MHIAALTSVLAFYSLYYFIILSFIRLPTHLLPEKKNSVDCVSTTVCSGTAIIRFSQNKRCIYALKWIKWETKNATKNRTYIETKKREFDAVKKNLQLAACNALSTYVDTVCVCMNANRQILIEQIDERKYANELATMFLCACRIHTVITWTWCLYRFYFSCSLHAFNSFEHWMRQLSMAFHCKIYSNDWQISSSNHH